MSKTCCTIVSWNDDDEKLSVEESGSEECLFLKIHPALISVMGDEGHKRARSSGNFYGTVVLHLPKRRADGSDSPVDLSFTYNEVTYRWFGGELKSIQLPKLAATG